MVHVTGNGVNKPGTYPLTRTATTLRQAIDAAQGLKFEADKDIRLARKTEDGKEIISKINYDTMVSDSTKDVVLQAGDRVIVYQSVWKTPLAWMGMAFGKIINVGLYGTYQVPISTGSSSSSK